MMNISTSMNAGATNNIKSSNSKTAEKPVWDPKKAYTYLEDISERFRNYKAKAVNYYRSDFSSKDQDGAISVEELKKTIKEYFPQYTFTTHEPKDPVAGKFYLYIDDSQLNKMASDPGYRARVFGLMDSELQGTKGYTLKYSDGRNVTNYATGTVFSLAESNRSIKGVGQMPGSEGIPYHGSCTGSGMTISSESHPQVRSQNFLDNNTGINAAKSQSNATREAAKRLAKKRAEKKKQEARLLKKAEQKKLEEKREERKTENEELIEEYILEGGRFDVMA